MDVFAENKATQNPSYISHATLFKETNTIFSSFARIGLNSYLLYSMSLFEANEDSNSSFDSAFASQDLLLRSNDSINQNLTPPHIRRRRHDIDSRGSDDYDQG